MDIVFDAETVMRMALEISVGLCIKLYVENGRVEWRDFKASYLFWWPSNGETSGASEESEQIKLDTRDVIAA